jgi:chromosome segregation ATPase
MPGGRSQRFAREDDAPIAVDGPRLESELLQRLEDQAAALSDTKGRLDLLGSALEAERTLRKQLAGQLEAERSKVEQLDGRVQHSQDAVSQVSELEAELERERARAEDLAMRLAEAWAEMQGIKEALHRPRGVLGRRRA